MARERLYKTEAVILRRSDMGEADRLLTLLTPERGKLRVLAKGARKIASRKAGHVELFTHVNLLIAQGRTWDIISQVETINAFRPLRADLLRASMAYYCAELVDRFSEEEQANPELFALMLETLQRVGDEPQPVLALRFFELHVLGLVGYQPELFHCVHCRKPLEPVQNYWSAVDGGVVCPQHGEGLASAYPLSLNGLKVLRFLQTRDWEQARRLNLSAAVQLEIEMVLGQYIAFVLERNLKSVAFLHRLRREMAQQAETEGADADS